MAIGWVRDRASEATSAISSRVSQGTQTVRNQVDRATQAAGQLYDTGRARFSEVRDQVGETVERVVDRAADAGQDLYGRARSGLSQVGERFASDSSVLGPLKYVNPGFYQGRALEAAGQGLSWVGGQAQRGVEFLDQHSRGLPAPVQQTMGVTAGALGFAGSLVEGAGSLAQYGGRMAQGDRETVDATVRVARGLGEGSMYLQGRAVEGAGRLVEGAGERVGLDLLEDAGSGLARVGQAQQGLASDQTRQTVDTLGQTAVHYSARLQEQQGQAVRTVGDWVGSEAVENAGERVVQGAQNAQDRTRNGLTEAIDQTVADRVQEYRENGAYAVPRDVTRLAGEVATLVVAPQAAAARVGRVGQVADAAVDAARLADRAGDATRTADRIADITRAGDNGVDAVRGVRMGRGPDGRFQVQEMNARYRGEHLPDNQVWHNDGVRYLNASEREAYSLTVRDGRLYDAQGNLFDTTTARSAHSGTGRAIFVMDDQGRLFASTDHGVGRFHHSSFLSGEPVAAAGELRVVNGELQLISNASGHYLPSASLTEQALLSLTEQGVDVSRVTRDMIH